MSDPMLPAGTGRCKCMACGRYFTSVSAFDLHQRQGKDGRNVCIDPEITKLVFSERGYWRHPGEKPAPEGAGEIRHAAEGAKTTHTKGSGDPASFVGCAQVPLFDGEAA